MVATDRTSIDNRTPRKNRNTPITAFAGIVIGNNGIDNGVSRTIVEYDAIASVAIHLEAIDTDIVAAFDELTRSNRDDLLVRQIKNAWPNAFRTARFIPAVEYIQANRLRSILIAKMDEIMSEVDLYIAPTFEGDNLLLTNLSGHPCVVLPNGFNEEGSPVSITFIGRLLEEATLLRLGIQVGIEID